MVGQRTLENLLAFQLKGWKGFFLEMICKLKSTPVKIYWGAKMLSLEIRNYNIRKPLAAVYFIKGGVLKMLLKWWFPFIIYILSYRYYQVEKLPYTKNVWNHKKTKIKWIQKGRLVYCSRSQGTVLTEFSSEDKKKKIGGNLFRYLRQLWNVAFWGYLVINHYKSSF